VADGVDAAVDAMQAAGRRTASDPAGAQPELLELGKGDHPVLAVRERREPDIAGGFVTNRPA
jgi:hypothetical protein